jgi:hypothetical protein
MQLRIDDLDLFFRLARQAEQRLQSAPDEPRHDGRRRFY